jgi:hypothetical protein
MCTKGKERITHFAVGEIHRAMLKHSSHVFPHGPEYNLYLFVRPSNYVSSTNYVSSSQGGLDNFHRRILDHRMGVHYLQQREHDVRMPFPDPPMDFTNAKARFLDNVPGVLRDDERRKRKMKEREEDFLRSQRKREIYESIQRVENIVQVPDSDTRGS